MSTQPEVEVSYDVGNEFFRLWLDERMNYTCAVFSEGDTLEIAQHRKLTLLADFARITDDMRVLDIGCGWGANLEYLACDRGVRDVHGITLSRAQHEEIERRRLPRVTASVQDYRTYEPPCRFDAVTCICMMEHIATPSQARKGAHVSLYREFFRRVHCWTRPGAWFALQTILRARVPRDREDLRELAWGTEHIFPGGIAPRLEDIVQAVSPYWEIMEVRTRREHYQKTTAAWLERLERHEGFIRERWGSQVYDDYRRYLGACVRAFARHYMSLAQYALRRIDADGVAGNLGIGR